MKKLLKDTVYTHYKNVLVHAYILHISCLFHSFGCGFFGFCSFWAPDFFNIFF